MLFSEKTVRIIRQPGRDRSRESSLSHLQQGFLPINTALTKAIRSDAKDGFYNDKPELLINDIKQDLALVGHCMRGIPKILTKPSARLDPLSDLPKLTPEQLDSLLGSAETSSKHDLSKASLQCIKRMRHAIIACAGAETLAEAVRERGSLLQKSEAFSVAYLRQIGLQLVAWNYPKIYSHAVDQARRGGPTIEEYIDTVLPQPLREINLAIAQSWNLHPELQALVTYGPRAFDETDSDRATLNKLVNFAETFARLGDQDIYPQAAPQWIDAVPEIAEIVGDDVIKFLPEKVHQACERSLVQLEAITQHQKIKKSAKVSLPSRRGQRFLDENREFNHAPLEVQGMLRQAYGAIAESGVSKDSLQRLISEVIPAAGFSRGCIFGVASNKKKFVPLLWLNDKRGTYFDPHEYFSPWTIADSMVGEIPLLKTGVDSQGEPLQFLSGLIGHPIPRGVLFLEVARSAAPDLQSAACASFRAIRIALYDCLRTE